MEHEYGYQLLKVEWNSEDHKSVRISAKRTNKQTGEADDFYIVAAESDEAPTNIILWSLAMEHKGMIQDNEYMRIIKGKQEVPNGYVLRGNRLIDVAEEKMRVVNTINAELDILYSGRVLALAEKDTTYAANRKRRVDHLLSLESHPDFPFVDLEEEK